MCQPVREEIESTSEFESEHEDEEDEEDEEDSFEYDEDEALGDPEDYYGEQQEAA